VKDARPWPTGEWRGLLADYLSDPDELLDRLDIDPSCRGGSGALEAERCFGMRLPRGFVTRIRRSDPSDPILRQVLPLAVETDRNEGFSDDPVGELSHPPEGGVLHKYRGRALVMVTGACAIHCRYCFRRHFPYVDHSVTADRWRTALDRIASDAAISEVILSGGDPLTLPDEALAGMVEELARLPQLRRLRIHTRLPIVLPQRVDEELVRWLGGVELPTAVVVHANHPHEIDGDVRRALSSLRATGATLLNQAVLLRGVNDQADALVELSEELYAVGVLPYYLHLLDRVRGAAHFEVGEVEALELVGELRGRLPGYLVPRLVREVAGAASKIPVDLRG
jgi:EF-P beta-lysylation protein EpmB